MTPPAPECTCGEPGKDHVTAKCGPMAPFPRVRLPRHADLQSGPLGISFQGSEYSFFFAIFRNCLWSAGCVRLRFRFPGKGMSAEIPKSAEQPRPRARVAKSNRMQVLLFVALTLILT